MLGANISILIGVEKMNSFLYNLFISTAGVLLAASIICSILAACFFWFVNQINKAIEESKADIKKQRAAIQAEINELENKDN